MKFIVMFSTLVFASHQGAYGDSSSDSTKAMSYKILPSQFDKADTESFFNINPNCRFGEPIKSPVNISWVDKSGVRISYEFGASDKTYENPNIGPLTQKDIVPDSLIHLETDRILGALFKQKAENFKFINFEKIQNQQSFLDSNSDIKKIRSMPLTDIYYAGRYLKKIDNRIVLGDGFQIRIGYGEGGAVSTISYREPKLIPADPVIIPSVKMVMDSIEKWKRSKTHSKSLHYPYRSENFLIKSLVPKKIFESFITIAAKGKDENQSGSFLVPTVTILAEATLNPKREKNGEPITTNPVLMHFHFPCRPAAGLCWPDGNIY